MHQDNRRFQLAIQLSKAVTKFLLALGLQDASTMVDATYDVIKMLPSRQRYTSNTIVDDSTISSATDLEFMMLLPIFLREGTMVDTGEQSAIITELIGALSRANLSLRVIADLGFDVDTVADRVRVASPFPEKFFSEEGTIFYDTLMVSVCQHIIVVVSQFPEFQSTAIAQIIQRQSTNRDDLLSLSDNILKSINQAISDIPSEIKDSESARFELKFRNSVARNLDQLEMFGIKDQVFSRRYPLSVSFISLTMDVERMPRTETEVKNERSVRFAADRRAAVTSVEQVLASSRRLLIQGTPGSGKSTLLQWIAVRSAERSFPEHLSDLNNTIPFLIRLREYSTKDLPTPKDLVRIMAPTIADMAPDTWGVSRFHREEGQNKTNLNRDEGEQDVVRQSTAILLVDGLDEISQERRKEVMVWIERYLRDFPDAYFVIASRDYAASRDWADRFKFVSTVLQPMSLPQMHLFVDKWFSAVAQTQLGDSEIETTLSLAPLVRQELQRSSDLRKLAVNPLLCALLCALYRTNRSLPHRRLRIYELASEMLLETLDRSRGVNLEDYPDVEYDQKRRIVEDIAFWMMMNSEPVVPLDRVQHHISETLAHMRDLDPRATPESVLKLLSQRSGLLRNPSVDTLDFGHRSFQEYFSAVHAVRQGSSGFLLQKSSDDAWRSVIMYAVGLMDIRQRRSLLEGLLKRGDKVPGAQRQMHLLAVACLEMCVELDPELEEEIMQRARYLLPPQSQGDVLALSRAGVALVPLLSRGQMARSSSEVAWSISTLVEIGGEQAVRALVEYASSEDIRESSIAHALLRAWLDLEEAGELGRYVIPRHIDQSHVAVLEQASTLEGFQHLKGMRVIAIRNCTMILDLAPLSYLSNLREIILTNCSNVRDLTPLSNLRGLTGLHLEGFNLVTDISPLAELENLQTLILRGFRSVEDLTPLSRLGSLQSLELQGFSRYADLAPISHLSQLRRLKLDGFAGPTENVEWRHLSKLSIVRGLDAQYQ